MDQERWVRVKSVFDDAVEMPTTDRLALLSRTDEDIRADVERMLDADRDDLIKKSPVFRLVNGHTGSPTPDKIKQYRIESEIARGGMGAVYLASRDDGEFHQKVAIKVIKGGMDSDDVIRRFRKERQILAELQHENIARLLDGGITEDGAPFYAMEFVDGVPITSYVSENRLPLDEILEIFRKVCSAVSYAHGQLIVHRDLKPSNIFVGSDGVPKLLDFGIAKILDAEGFNSQHTATLFGMMTPAYASPEQARGEKVTTAADVYSLGVIFYELLSGRRPYETDGKGYSEVVELISRSVPVNPSSFTTHRDLRSFGLTLKGDLDNIALKALQKNPTRRYRSVEEFSEDIRRHLAGLPVTARPDTAAYRVSKFVKRNKVSAAAATLVLISLCVGISVALWQANQARQQRTLSERRFNEVRQLANNVVFKYHDAIADLPGSTKAREMLVSDALQYLNVLAEESTGDAELQKELAQAYMKLGDVQGKMYAANVGETAGALNSYRKAVGLLEAVVDTLSDTEAKTILVKAYDTYVFATLRSGDSGTSEPIVRKAFALLDQLPESRERELQKIDLYLRLGDVDVVPGPGETRQNIPRRLSHHLNAEPLIERLLSDGGHDTATVKVAARVFQRLGSDYSVLGEYAEGDGQPATAQGLYASALVYNQKVVETVGTLITIAPDDPVANKYQLVAESNLAEALALNGRFEEALILAKRYFDDTANISQADPQNKEARLGESFANELYGKIHLRQGNVAKGLEYFNRSLTIDEIIFRNDQENIEAAMRSIIDGKVRLANIYEKAGQRKMAEQIRSSERMFREKLGR